MTDRSIADYLDDIERAAEDLQEFCRGLSKDEFISSRQAQYATFWCFLVIGEAASKLIDEHKVFITENTALPWKSMKGLRNRIAHGYNSIDPDVVWATIQLSIPQLLQEIPWLRAAAQAAGPSPRPG